MKEREKASILYPLGQEREGVQDRYDEYAVATLVQCFDWEVSGEGDGAKVDMQSGQGMSLHMSHPLIVRPIVHFNPCTASM